MTTKKSKKNQLPVKDAFTALRYIFAAILMSSCSNRYVFQGSKKLPDAEAEVKIDKNKNNNYQVELEVENITRPEGLSPAKRNYMVWAETENHETVNLGNLGVSSQNKAEMTSITSNRPIRIFITAEDGLNVTRPSKQVVLHTGRIDVD